MKTISLFLFATFVVLAHAEDKLYDEELAKNAVGVLRVEYARDFSSTNDVGNGLFTTYLVWPRRVLKDESGELSTHTFSVCVLKGREGIPLGESTIYLEKYSSASKGFNKTNGFWVLVGGDATNGVSHIASRTQ